MNLQLIITGRGLYFATEEMHLSQREATIIRRIDRRFERRGVRTTIQALIRQMKKELTDEPHRRNRRNSAERPRGGR